MYHRHPVPRVWLMTDERIGTDDMLAAALARLPPGSGVVFRHYGLSVAARRTLFRRVAAIARRRRLVLVMAGDRGARADGRHGPRMRRRGATGLVTRPVHDRAGLVAARRARVDAVFVSPVFPTRSHPGARALGLMRFASLVRDAGIPVIALGGVDATRWPRLRALGAHGWAGIDAWSAPNAIDQKRSDVPT